MVGLSVVLEGYNDKDNINTITPGVSNSTWHILNKASMVLMKPPSPPSIPSSPFSRRKSPATSGFLDSCFLCKQKLLPGKDIYMYKGEWAFCSVECRCKQIFMDEEESIKTKKNRKSQASTSSSSNNNNNKSCTTTSSSSSSSSSSSRCMKTAARNRPNGFAY
ncbi:FCS-Like Zinc finger 15 [Solanum dulcamara]|uniref:FCS-Like Zinc finger 15 n=1 Tax=Solanum dulcamara TaxID=45834 RepID=UPI002485FD04|nr:FCS-Like Zinc finger 15 [Solanum dulcamara]